MYVDDESRNIPWEDYHTNSLTLSTEPGYLNLAVKAIAFSG